jgi:RNA 3'-terminal phosphate cyclase (ATP)
VVAVTCSKRSLQSVSDSSRYASTRESILTMPASPVHLDGTTLEGGGQLLRLALSLSSLTHIPFHVTKVRGNRSKGGGLKPAHLAGVEWLAKATGAQTEGMEVKSKELVFRPSAGTAEYRAEQSKNETRGVWEEVYEVGRLVRRQSHIFMSTPGSILLVLQAILPFLLFVGSSKTQDTAIPLRITIEGGTNVSNSPSIEYAIQVLLPLLTSKVGIPPISVTLHRRGWSTGRADVGSVTFDIHPLSAGSTIPTFLFQDRGGLTKAHVSILAPDAKARSLIREKVTAHLLAFEPELEITFPIDENSGHDKRLYLLIVAETSNSFKLGRDWLYDRKMRGSSPEESCETLVSKVVKDLKRELKHGGCVDEYMQDQLVVFQALAAGKSEVDGGKGREESLHTRTAIWVVEQVLGLRFDDRGRCEGVGFRVGEDFLGRNGDGADEATEGIANLSL